jgi:hypothetical protein
MTFSQTAPFPAILADLVERTTYRPGWEVRLADEDRGQGSRGLTLVVMTKGFDSYHPDRGENYCVNHYFPVPPAAYNERSWRHWLLRAFCAVEKHEAMEFFRIDGECVFPPAHGPGNDPYLVLDYGTEADKRTKYTGELNPASPS